MHILNMDSKTGDRVEEGGGGSEEKAAAATSKSECSIDVKEGDDRSRKVKKVCRICHFGKDIIALGCDCKGELGSCHRHCADLWFSHKGDTVCEICGKRAKNIRNNADEETSIFMMEWNEIREVAASLEASSGESRHRCKQCFCHWVLASFILLFMLLWFLRGIKIL
ncbi:hypothetical protein ACS0TY_032536 [Phlomoides rotata]